MCGSLSTHGSTEKKRAAPDLGQVDAGVQVRDPHAVARSGRTIYTCDSLPDARKLPAPDRVVCVRGPAEIGHMSTELCDGLLVLQMFPDEYDLYRYVDRAARQDLASHCSLCEFGRIGEVFELQLCAQIQPEPYDARRGSLAGARSESKSST